MKQKRTEVSFRVLWLGLMLILLVAAMIPVLKTGILSCLGREDVYWERARYLLGQGGLSTYDGKSLCSLGYSLLLLPICVAIKSPYAAFKAALILNGIFLMESYAVSFAVAKKIFPEEKKTFLSVLCFFITVCPVFAVERLQTGPESAVLLLIWIALFLLVELREKYSAKKIALLTADLIVIGFLQITALGVIVGVMAILGILAKKGQIPMTSYLRALLVLMLGLAAGNIAERMVLYGFASGMDVTVSSSLEVLLDDLADGWSQGFLTGVLEGIAGKLYSLMAGTLLLICPGIWALLKKCREMKKGRIEKEDPFFGGVLLIFVFQLLIAVLTANASGISGSILSLDYMTVIAGPVLLVGAMQLKKSAVWDKELLGYLLALCLSSFVTASIFNGNAVDIAEQVNTGFLYVLISKGLSLTAGIYLQGCAVLLAGIVLFICLRGECRRPMQTAGIRTVGMLGLAVVFLGGGFWIQKRAVLAWSEASMEQEAVIASLLQQMDQETEIYCYVSGNLAEKNSVILQSLMPQHALQKIEKSGQEKAEFFDSLSGRQENVAVSTGTDENLLYEMELGKLNEFQLVYVAGEQALWVRKGSTACEQAETAAEERMMRLDGMPHENTDETESMSEDGQESVKSEVQTYGNGVVLAPGTYRTEIILKKVEDVTDFTGEVTIKDGNGRVTGIDFGPHNFSDDGTGLVSLEFTGRHLMRDVMVEITVEKTDSIRVDEIRYRKYTDAYMIGCEEQTSVILTSDTIKELDQNSHTQGSVAYVDGKAERGSDISLERFAAQLPEYELQAVTLDELQTDYLISDTDSHDYYDVMEQYSIVRRDDAFTLLVRKDSVQGGYASGEQKLLSDGRQIEMRCYTGTDENAGKSIALGKGTYLYHAKIQGSRRLTGADEETVGRIGIYSGKKMIASQSITIKDLNEQVEIQIPFSLVTSAKQLRCEFETTENFSNKVQVTVTPTTIELKARSYQYGTETEKLNKWYQLFKHTEGNYSVAVVSLAKNMERELSDLSDLQSKIGSRQAKEITYEEAFTSKEDRFLITYDFAARALKLLTDYTIVDQIGQYTLLVRSDGALLDICREKGYGALSSGSRFRPQVMAAARGKEYTEGQIEYLPTGRYRLTLELEATDLTVDDTVEVYLMRDKTKAELDEERTALETSGYTDDEIEEVLEKRTECGSLTCEGYRFDGSERIIVTIETDKKCKITDLTAEAYSWQGKKAEAKILWVEMV